MRRLLLIGAVLCPQLVLGQDIATLTPLTDPFNEIVLPAPQTSGTHFVGFVAASALAAGQTVPTFSAALPQDWKGGDICLSVTSADGLYDSRNTYAVPQEWEGGVAAFAYPTDRPGEVSGRALHDMAVAVNKGDCSATEDEVAVAYLNADAGGSVRLLLNAFRAEETLVFVGEGSRSRELPCKSAEVTVPTAFDTSCEIPPEVLAPGMAEITIVAIKDGVMGRPMVIRLRGIGE